MRRTGPLLALILLAPAPAAAGVADFLATCVAAAADLGRLPAVLAASGWVEVIPSEGPTGPAIAQAAEGRRLWSRPVPGGGDAFTGLTAPGPARPVAVCWHISRPGEAAAVALPALRRRFPPIEGTREAGPEFYYGGFERWGARVDGQDVILGMSWPFRSRPEEGTGFLHLVRPTPPGGR